MATDRRRAVATASTGAGLTVAGGVLRQQGLHAAHGGNHPGPFDLRHPVSTHQTRALLRTGARGRKRYLLGATLGLVGAPALAVGIHDTVTRKRDDRRSFVGEGLRGTQTALEQRAESIKEVPPQHKAGPLAVSAGAGFTGSLAAHRTLDRLKSFHGARHSARAGITALAGTTLAGASYPLARHTVRSPEYEVTPTGVRRRKKPIVRPSSKSSKARSQTRSFTADLSKSLDPRILSTRAYKPIKQMTRSDRQALRAGLKTSKELRGVRFGTDYRTGNPKPDTQPLYSRGKGTYRRNGAVYKVLNPHALTPTTARGTPRKVHWREHGNDHAVCGLDGAFGRGTGPFAEHYGEVTCRGCSRMMRIAKAATGDYAGRRTSTTTQRAAILAAGATPVVGGVAGARTAGHFAPPGKRTRTETRQYGLTTAGSLGGGLAGAYGTSALASRHSGVARATERAAATHRRASEKVRSFKPVNATLARLPKGSARLAHAKQTALGSKIARPLRRSPIAAGVGYVAGKTIGGYAGSGIAMRRNQADQREFNLKHPVTKYVENMTTTERRKLSRKKRYAAASSTTTGVLGLGALAARAHKRPDLALNLLTGSAAIGGVNNLNFAGVLRREAKATDPRSQKVTKGVLVAKADRREPLTRMHADTAAQLVARHGDAGPLPSTLSRSERMQAYEARYVHAGGHKAEHWQRRADRADKIKTGGLAGATAGGVGIMALRHPRVARALGHRLEHARHAVDSATIGAATVSGAGELYAGHARRRRASYSNSKAGVAASALRRMKDYAA